MKDQDEFLNTIGAIGEPHGPNGMLPYALLDLLEFGSM